MRDQPRSQPRRRCHVLGHRLCGHGGDAARRGLHGGIPGGPRRKRFRQGGGGRPRRGGSAAGRGTAGADAAQRERSARQARGRSHDAAGTASVQRQGRPRGGSPGTPVLLDRRGATHVGGGRGIGHRRGAQWVGVGHATAPRPDPPRGAPRPGELGGRSQRPPEEADPVTGRNEVVASRERFAREREKMVEQQLVARGITDPRVLAAMRRVPRHLFVDEALRERAYGDHPLPIGEGQTISQPFIVGRMTELLKLVGVEKGLEIGTGSGYQAAVLAEGASRVCTVERLPRLGARARQTLEALAYTNVWVRTANGTFGWPDEAPFDRILVAAGGPSVPPPLFEQLAEGGRMVIPVGEADTQRLQVIEKVRGEMRVTDDSGCVFVKLIGKYAWQT